MSELSIKVNIANRTYPLSVVREEEEEVRKAAKYINDRLQTLQKSFVVNDKIDLFAMLALEMTLEKGHGKEELVHDNIAKSITDLIDKIDLELTSK